MASLAVPRALVVLRHRHFRLLAAGQFTSNAGDACYAVALPWYVLAGHGGTLLLGTVLATYGVPRTMLIGAGGYASDRWRPQAVMMATDIARTLAVAALAVAAADGPARAVVLLPIAAVLGAGQGLFLPGSFSILPTLLPGENLQAGNALSASATQFATLVGPAIGGAFVAQAGPSLAFAFDALSFAVSVATLAGLRTAAPAPARADAVPTTTSERVPALRTVLRSERVLPVILMVVIVANLGSGGMSDVALPALAHAPLHAGAGGYGAMLAAFAAGALAGSLAAGQFRGVRRPAIAASVAYLAVAACMGIAPYLGSTLAVAVALAGCGISNGFANIVLITAYQRWAPPSLLGRLSGLLMLSSLGVFPVSVALAALVVHDLGPEVFFVFAAAILALAILAGLSLHSWRDFGTDTGPAAITPIPNPQSAWKDN